MQEATKQQLICLVTMACFPDEVGQSAMADLLSVTDWLSVTDNVEVTSEAQMLLWACLENWVH